MRQDRFICLWFCKEVLVALLGMKDRGRHPAPLERPLTECIIRLWSSTNSCRVEKARRSTRPGARHKSIITRVQPAPRTQLAGRNRVSLYSVCIGGRNITGESIKGSLSRCIGHDHNVRFIKHTITGVLEEPRAGFVFFLSICFGALWISMALGKDTTSD